MAYLTILLADLMMNQNVAFSSDAPGFAGDDEDYDDDEVRPKGRRQVNVTFKDHRETFIFTSYMVGGQLVGLRYDYNLTLLNVLMKNRVPAQLVY